LIKLISAHIEEMRGIRKLDIDFRKGNFAISGPNGSGKSGVIDAIEFALTGQISRLTGTGTKGLTIAEHGPHVDKTKFPDAAFVELKVFLPTIGRTATISRKVSSPKKPKIAPADNDIKAVFAEIGDHPEIALSRREILRFILVEPTKRSEEIQTILKLDEIGQTRSALNTAQNRLQSAQRNATALVESSRGNLLRHLQTATLNAEDLLKAVNSRRKPLGLSEITTLTADSKLDSGLSIPAGTPEFNKQSALRDLKALSEATLGFPDLAKAQAAGIVSALVTLESDPALYASLRRRPLIEKGLDLLDGPDCPLCDNPWGNEQHLREHLKAKLAKSEDAHKLQQVLLDNSASLAREARGLATLLAIAQKIAAELDELGFAELLNKWRADLDALQAGLANIDGITSLKKQLQDGWLEVPKAFTSDLKALTDKTESKPDQSTALDAQTFLTTAQLRLSELHPVLLTPA
jgi:hypothetical protein